MRRTHAIGIAVLLSLAGVAGTVALAKTVALGQSSSAPAASQLQARAARLERAEAQLRAARDRMPPPLPPLPTAAPAASGRQATPVSGNPGALVQAEDDDRYALDLGESEHGWEHEHGEMDDAGYEDD
jgi:Flp pilus assembly protein TadD